MVASIDPIQQFFHEFERNTDLGEVPASVSQFADVFMAASPAGANAVRVSDFALALPKRKQLFDKLGCRSTTLTELSQTRLDDRYILVETKWRMRFTSADQSPQDVLAGSTFIVDRAGEHLKIVFYLSHQDIMAVLRDRGILKT